MSDKYSWDEKYEIYNQYFESDNILKQSLEGLPRYNSKVDDDIIKENKLIFELLELRGPDLIRFAIGRNCDCTCRSFVCDERDINNLTDMLLERRIQKQQEYIRNNTFVND
jgi:hypothetical protein